VAQQHLIQSILILILCCQVAISQSLRLVIAQFTVTTHPGVGGNSVTVGIGDGSLNGYTGFDANHSAAQFSADPEIFINSTAVLTRLTTFPTDGDFVLECFDAGAKLLWLSTNGGTWNGSFTSTQVAAGTGGQTVAAITGPYFAGVAINAVGGVITANFSPSGMPSGYSGW
jgi:hypothetical protein